MSTVSARALTLVGLWAAAGCGVPGRTTKVDPAKAFLAAVREDKGNGVSQTRPAFVDGPA